MILGGGKKPVLEGLNDPDIPTTIAPARPDPNTRNKMQCWQKNFRAKATNATQAKPVGKPRYNAQEKAAIAQLSEEDTINAGLQRLRE